MLREMQDASPDKTGGGFYSAYDADSEGHEGKFYVWTRTEAHAALTPLEWTLFSRRFGFDEEPNFEGAWHAHVFVSIEQIAKEHKLEPAEIEKHIDSARAKLLAIRSKRVWPGLDDKVLGSWNALAIRGLAKAARLLDKPEFAAAAERALEFIRANLWRPGPNGGGRLLATAKDGVAHLNAYLDDYAYLANALLEMLQLRWRNEDAAWLRDILDGMLAHFEDSATRRILLHLGRSRGADPSQQELQRRRHPGGQWHRRQRADSRRLSVRRDALAHRCRAHTARRLARDQSLPARPHEPARSAG